MNYIIYLLTSDGLKHWGERHDNEDSAKELTDYYNSTANRNEDYYFYQVEY